MQNDKLKLKVIRLPIVAFFFVILYPSFLFFPLRFNKANAQEMSSQNFKVQGGNFSITSGNKASENFRLTDLVGQTAAGQFASKGYIIQSGFADRASGQELTFSLSPSVVNFGNLTASQPVEKTVVLTIANSDIPGYTVQVSENQPLSTLAAATIVDTRCDATPTPCTALNPAAWVKNITYGFGYRMDGPTAPDSFAGKDLYAPFSVAMRNEQPVTVLASKAAKVRDQAVMTFKLNVDANQPVGQYRNIISFIALTGI